MIHRFTSEEEVPFDRGVAFGEAWRTEVAQTIAGYEALFASATRRSVDLLSWGDQARQAITQWAPKAATEIEGIARGANVTPEFVYAINARTEILGVLAVDGRGECSTVVRLRDGEPPLTVQTWDWHAHLADDWLVWTISLPDGSTVQTLTEFGIVGKIGVTDRGFGVHFNLLGHSSDGGPIGVPVHVIARRVLEEARDLDAALQLVASARASASTTLTFVATDGRDSTALSVEVTPEGPFYVLPDSNGLLIHTNHFLNQVAAKGDREPKLAGDSFVRYDYLHRRLADRLPESVEDIVAALDSHLGGACAVCAHPSGEHGSEFDYATLATVSIDVPAGRLAVHAGGPCSLASANYRLEPHKGTVS